MATSFSIEWDGIEAHGSLQGERPVHWVNDWANIEALEIEGLVSHIHRGPSTYGHVDYYLTDKGLTLATVS